MDIKQQIKKFDEENKPFYMMDHEDGVYSLCLPLSFLSEEYRDFGQEAFNQYTIRAGESVTDFIRMEMVMNGSMCLKRRLKAKRI